MMIQINTKYNVGDKIFHVTPDSPPGLIIDVIYSFRKKETSYLIAWDHLTESCCLESEITSTKNFS